MKTCTKCKVEKENTEFYYRTKEATSTHVYCKKCMTAFQVERWRKRKEKAVAALGGECARCGYKRNNAALDFHHKDPQKKTCEWRKLRLKSWVAILAELAECILLCKNCHAEEHNA